VQFLQYLPGGSLREEKFGLILHVPQQADNRAAALNA